MTVMHIPAVTPRHAAFTLNDARHTCLDLPGMYGAQYFRLPVVLRLLLENALRNMHDAERDAAAAALFGWLEHGTSEAEIAFQPGRVLMHDTTSTPALVDIAAMRDALAEAGVDPSALNPVLPVDVSVDHSLAVQSYARWSCAATPSATASCAGPPKPCRMCASIRQAPASCTPSTWNSWRPWFAGRKTPTASRCIRT
jgi:aconitate hydratase